MLVVFTARCKFSKIICINIFLRWDRCQCMYDNSAATNLCLCQCVCVQVILQLYMRLNLFAQHPNRKWLLWYDSVLLQFGLNAPPFQNVIRFSFLLSFSFDYFLYILWGAFNRHHSLYLPLYTQYQHSIFIHFAIAETNTM